MRTQLIALFALAIFRFGWRKDGLILTLALAAFGVAMFLWLRPGLGVLAGPVTAGSGRHPLPDWETFQQTLGAWGIDQHSQVIAYDQNNGMFAARLWWMLRALGHEAVAVLDGGVDKWNREGLAMEDGNVNNTRKRFGGKPKADWMVSAREVGKNLSDPKFALIDSRDPARYSGEIEPIDPAAGHIPGAVNHFFGDNLNDSGEFLPKDKLRAQFESLLEGGKPEDAVFYCGSGVSACHNLLALAHAGLSGAKLYVGSWSEWAADPKRPINTGERP